MEAIVNVILPVFAIVALGYGAGRGGLLGSASSQALNAFVFFFSLPALMFGAMARLPLDQVFNLSFLAVFLGGLLACFLPSFLVARIFFPERLGGLTMHAMTAVFSNTGYMGIPLLMVALGPDGLLPAIIGTMTTGALIMAVVTVLLEIDRHSHQTALTIAGKVVRGLVLNPLILSASCGLLWNALALPVPTALGTFLDLMGDTAGPCALFAMGLFLVGKPLRHGLGEVLWVSLVKLVVMPAVTWWLAFDVFMLEPFWARSAVLLAALPTGALVFVVAQRYEVYVQRAISAILINTVLSVVTLSVLLSLLGIV